MIRKQYTLIVLLLLVSIRLIAQPVETIYSGNLVKSGYANDESYGPFNIGFNFTFFGNSYSQFYVNSNGQVLFGTGSTSGVDAIIPTATLPNNFIAGFWDDLTISSSGKILYNTIGASPNRKLIIQFVNMNFYNVPSLFGTFLVILYESTNKIQVQYRLIVDDESLRSHGSTASIGLENSDGSAGVKYSYHDPAAISNEQAISFTPSDLTYTTNSNALYDGVYLTTNLSLPEPGITTLVSPALNAIIGANQTFEWAAASNAAGYTLMISTRSDLMGATTYNPGTNLTYDVTGLTLDVDLFWGVFASNETGVTWCETKKFTTRSSPPLAAVPQTVWIEQLQDKTVKLNYTGGDESPKTAIITSLPPQGQLFQYNAGARGTQIISVPTTVNDAGRNVIYSASGSSGNGAGNFNFKMNDAGGDSPEVAVTINVSPPGVPSVLYIAKNANVEIQFDRLMADPTGKQGQFTVMVNGSPATISSATLKTADPYTFILALSPSLAGTETVLASYTQGDVASTSGGLLFSFSDQPVTLTSQTITFTQSLDKKFSDSPFTLTATSSSGLGMTYSSSNLGVTTISAHIATFVSVGSADVTARQAGNGTFAPVKYIRTITVAKGDQTIGFGPLAIKYSGDPDFASGAVATSSLPVGLVSANPAVATITGGLIHIVGVGTSLITASQPGNANYNAAADVPQTLTVDFPTGVENPFALKESFNIYYGFGRINIQTLSDEWEGKTGTLRVFDIIGKPISILPDKVFKKNSLIQIDPPFNNGIYIIELKTGVLKYVRKILIK